MATVTFKYGEFKKVIVQNRTYEMIQPYNPERGYILVRGDKYLLKYDKIRNCRVKVRGPEDFEYHDYNGEELPAYGQPVDVAISTVERAGAVHLHFDPVKQYIANETDDMAMDRIKKSFDHLDMFAEGAADGIIKGLIVSGEPGIGKSFGVMEVMERHNCLKKLSDEDRMYDVVKGAISAPFLYRKLYEFRHKGNVLVLDDCEIEDIDCINLLKAALDTCDIRIISWFKEAHWLKRDGIEEKFKFEGGVIYLTNDKMTDRKGKSGLHLGAIVSRCHFLDLEINSVRDKLLRIKQIIRDGMLRSYYFEPELEQQIVEYVVENAEHFRELSLRTCVKLADLVKAFPHDWEDMAESSLMKQSAKYARLIARQRSYNATVNATIDKFIDDLNAGIDDE